MRRCLMLLTSILLFANTAAFAAEGAPSAAEAEAAMRELFVKAKGTSPEGLRVREVQACFPAHGRPAGDFVCVLEMSMPGGDGNFRTQVLPFRQSKGSWSLLNPDEEEISPACPSHSEAQRAFRRIKKNETIVVTGGEGEGNIHNERGMFEKVEGPYRLVCTYSVKSTMAGEKWEQTFVTYIWRKGGTYDFDPDIEVWTDD